MTAANLTESLAHIVYFPVHATDESGDAPLFIKVEVDEAFKAKLRRLTAACLACDLTEARVWLSNATWLPEDVVDDLRLSGEELVVAGAMSPHPYFWFTCWPKHGNYRCETPLSDVEGFLDAVERGEQYMGCDPDALRELVEASHEHASA